MSNDQESSPKIENKLLAALPPEDRQRLLPHMQNVRLPLGKVIIKPEGNIPNVYFPTGALISLVSMMEDGRSVEAGVIGVEGMAGLPVVLGGGATPMRSTVQIEGTAIKIKSDVAKAEFDKGGALQDVLHRYMHVLFVCFSQSAACNRLHPIEGRLARWLLMATDSVQSQKLRLTHDYLGTMLGIRRAGVTEACISLRDQGLIYYFRGNMEITNRKGLENTACECYAIVKKEFDRLIN